MILDESMGAPPSILRSPVILLPWHAFIKYNRTGRIFVKPGKPLCNPADEGTHVLCRKLRNLVGRYGAVIQFRAGLFEKLKAL